MLLSAAVMIWVIPQPFSRIILLSLIFSGYYDRLDLSKTTRSALMLGLYYVSILLNMTMLRGDIILNGALVSMAGLSLSEGRWMLYMTLPTLGYLLLGVVLFRILFRDALKGFAPRAAPWSLRPAAVGTGQAEPCFHIAHGDPLGHGRPARPVRHVGGHRGHGADVPPRTAAPAGFALGERKAAGIPHGRICHRGDFEGLRRGRQDFSPCSYPCSRFGFPCPMC
jgi:hypothetical protein